MDFSSLFFVNLFSLTLFRCHNFNVNVTNPRKRLNIQIEANGSEATYAGACMTIIASYGGKLILKFCIDFSRRVT